MRGSEHFQPPAASTPMTARPPATQSTRAVVVPRLEALRARSMADVEAILGHSDQDIGSGIHIYIYVLDNGLIRVGTPDDQHVS